MSIEATRAGFEDSFEEADFYNKQTQDEKHLKDILATINVKPGMKILDLGCGSGYLPVPIAEMNENAHVIGLDIVTDTLERNTKKAIELITVKLGEKLSIAPSDIFIVMSEPPLENWGMGGYQKG